MIAVARSGREGNVVISGQTSWDEPYIRLVDDGRTKVEVVERKPLT